MWYAMLFNDSDYEEMVELTEDAKKHYQKEAVPRSEYNNYPTKAVAIIVYGKDKSQFWLQQRPIEGRKPGYWEIVAGSKSIEHKDAEQAAKEEIKEELFDYDKTQIPEKINLEHLGYLYKDTENPQRIDVYIYESGRTSFPGSDEVKQGKFVPETEIKNLPDNIQLTDCTKHVLTKLDLIESRNDSFEDISEGGLETV